MLSSRNLIVNGGFAGAAPDGSLRGWDAPDGASWQRIAVPEYTAAGLPQSGFAMQVTIGPGRAGGALHQRVALPPGLPGRFALRVAARGRAGRRGLRLAVSVALPDGPQTIAEAHFALARDWQRHRLAFDVAGFRVPASVDVTIHASGGTGSICVTDIRLVALNAAAAPLALRFDTRGDLSLASSRLRAWTIADYLDLVGWPVAMNRGDAFDLYVCQKVRHRLRLRRARRDGRAVLYDLDDNEPLISTRETRDIRAFVKAVDGATAGSAFLREMMAAWNDNTMLFENPVDVLDPDIAHQGEVWDGRLVWFGMPENLWMLRELHLTQPVTTITRGGDIEYSLKSVDRHLVDFDLALLPVFLNDETRAKNANRLVKCVGLGLPFLATDTPEHRRALQRLQLPASLLVAPDGDWPARIVEIGKCYADCKRLLTEARPRAFEVYGIERIAAEWVAFCRQILAAKALAAP